MNKIILFIFLLNFNLHAEDIDWSKYQTEDDLASLTQEQIMSIPMTEFSRLMYKEGESPKLFSKSGIEFMTQYQLSVLGYFLNQNSRQLDEKVKTFQKTLGQKETGELSYGQFNKLMECTMKMGESTIIPLGSTIVSIEDEYAYAEASLVIDDGNDIYLEETDSAMPITKSIIQCRKKEGTCRISTADIKPTSYGKSDSTHYLSLDTNTWSVDSWTKDKITLSDISLNSCRTSTMTLNSVSKEIVQLTTNNNKEECDFMGISTELARPQVVKSVDPLRYSYAYWQARKDKTREMCLGSDLLEEIKQEIGQ